MTDLVGEPSVTPIPPTTPPIAQYGGWTNGLADFIDNDHFEALKRMSGLTVAPDVLDINGHKHLLDQIDDDKV
jgi:hypothetical protein